MGRDAAVDGPVKVEWSCRLATAPVTTGTHGGRFTPDRLTISRWPDRAKVVVSGPLIHRTENYRGGSRREAIYALFGYDRYPYPPPWVVELLAGLGYPLEDRGVR